MKPFNIAAAKRGEKVVTREGYPVRIVCYNAKCIFPLIGLINKHGREYTQNFCIDGRYLYDKETPNDLFMAEPSKKNDIN